VINASQFLAQLRQATSWDAARSGLHVLLTDLIDQIGNGFSQLGVQTSGKVQPPAPLENLSVVANNGTVHAVLTHNAPVNKTIRYFVEASANDDSFAQPHVFDLGTSRSLFTSLPNKDGNGATINWKFRAYSQYHGSDPSEALTLGGPFKPTPVNVGGSAQFTPLPSTGSGTAPANGQRAGQGLGVDFQRPAIGPKRVVA
jgi:hypothetical protein